MAEEGKEAGMIQFGQGLSIQIFPMMDGKWGVVELAGLDSKLSYI